MDCQNPVAIETSNNMNNRLLNQLVASLVLGKVIKFDGICFLLNIQSPGVLGAFVIKHGFDKRNPI